MSRSALSSNQTASLRDYRCQVVSNTPCGNGLMRLRLQVMPLGNELPLQFSCQPGQFVMLDLPESGFWFRRPFSVLTVNEPDQFELYYKIVGAGTKRMAHLRSGEALSCLGSLGIGFQPPEEPETALYIGGGIGIAPLYFLKQRVGQGGYCFYGVRSQQEIGLLDELQALFGDSLAIATDDGSFGLKGNVCHALETLESTVRAAKEAYVCGPTLMMQAVSTLLYRINPTIRVQVSLEERMPCGTGACTGCVTPRADQLLPSKVCLEGPVFDARSIRWASDVMIAAPAACEANIPCLS
jgi:dihydroorotate dehydrogenase electron transfer subunit